MTTGEQGAESRVATPSPADEPIEATQAERLKIRLQELFQRAMSMVDGDGVAGAVEALGDLGTAASDVAVAKHASRGALLTLALYKAEVPNQDIRYNKSEFTGGFSARTVDTIVTVPFLMQESLPRNVESHWLTQTLSFANSPWTRGTVLNTVPKNAGPQLVDAVNLLEEMPEDEQAAAAERVAVIVLARLIEERNKGKVYLTRPKGKTILEVRTLLSDLLSTKFRSGSPRLPQLMMYAIYLVLFETGQPRYATCQLAPLGRMKAADRKAGTVGDVVVTCEGVPKEAVETKFDIPISLTVVGEAMEKVKALTVERYLILSTAGVSSADSVVIDERIRDFKISNGCEIIVNGVLETISYYLRLLPDTNAFVNTLADLLETDIELGYEHRVAWNRLCLEF